MNKIKTLDVLKVVAAGGIIVGSAIIPSLPMILVGAIKLWRDVNKTDLGRDGWYTENYEVFKISFQNKKNGWS